jgi:hypothetical protein
MHTLWTEARARLQANGTPRRQPRQKHSVVGIQSRQRNEQGGIRELRTGLRHAVGFGKKAAGSIGAIAKDQRNYYRQTSLVRG